MSKVATRVALAGLELTLASGRLSPNVQLFQLLNCATRETQIDHRSTSTLVSIGTIQLNVSSVVRLLYVTYVNVPVDVDTVAVFI